LILDFAAREEEAWWEAELEREVLGGRRSALEQWVVGGRCWPWGDCIIIELEKMCVFSLSGWQLELAAHWIMCFSLKTLLVCFGFGYLWGLTVVNFISFIIGASSRNCD
jgi:hypothetical protein